MGGNGIPVVAHRASRLSALVMILAVALALLPSAALAKSRTAEAIGAPTDDQAVGYQINPAHDGVQADATLVPPLVSKWGIRFRNEYVSYPLIAGEGKDITMWSFSWTARDAAVAPGGARDQLAGLQRRL